MTMRDKAGSRDKRRLLIAQSPGQLLAGMMCLAYEVSAPNGCGRTCKDILIIGGYYANSHVEEQMDLLCVNMAGMHNFSRIVKGNDIKNFYAAPKHKIDEWLKQVRTSICPEEIDEIFFCRNTQWINEVIAAAYPEAKKIGYGDGHGQIDSGSHGICPSELGIKPSPLDSIRCLAPMDCTGDDLFSSIPVELVPLPLYYRFFLQAVTRLPNFWRFCRKVNADFPGHKHLITLANLTECHAVSGVKEEVSFYLDYLLAALPQKAVLLVKPHPRQHNNQADILANELKERGYTAISLNDYSVYPAELISLGININVLHTFGSSSGFGFRLLHPQTDIVLGIPFELVDKYVVSPIYNYFLCFTREQTNIEMASKGLFMAIPEPLQASKDKFPLVSPGIALETRAAFRAHMRPRLDDHPKTWAAIAKLASEPDGGEPWGWLL